MPDSVSTLPPDFLVAALLNQRDGLVILDDEGKIVYWNTPATEMFGHSQKRALGQDFQKLIVPVRYHSKLRQATASLKTQEKGALFNRTVDLFGLRSDGHEFAIELSLAALTSQGRWYATGTLRDRTEQFQQQQAIEHDWRLKLLLQQVQTENHLNKPLDKKLQSITNMLLDSPWVSSGGWCAIYLRDGNADASARAASITAPAQLPKQIPLGRPRRAGHCPKDDVNVETCSPLQALCGNQANCYCATLSDNGSDHAGLLFLYLGDDTGRDPEIVDQNFALLVNELSLLLKHHQATRSVDRLSDVVEQAPVAIATTDPQARFTYVNTAFCRVTGYQRHELLGQTPRLIQSGNTPTTTYKELWKTITSGGVWHGEIQNRRKNGELFWEAERISPLLDEMGKIEGYVVIKEDITLQRYQNDQLQFMATYDRLTALPNTTLTLDRLAQSLEHCHREDKIGALFFIDICGLSSINEQHGHAMGDRLIKAVATRLSKVSRAKDTLGRYGGDKFALVVADITDASDIGTIARKLSDALDSPLLESCGSFEVGCDIGIVRFPQDGDTPDLLFRRADLALHVAKDNPHHNVRYYDARLESQSLDAASLLADLRQALAKDQLELYYQPKNSLKSGKIIGTEALIRWNHPSKGIIPPDRFIDLAERSGLIIAIGSWVIRQAARQIAAWQKTHTPVVPVSVNVSARQFADIQLSRVFANAIAENGIAPQLLEMELTESVLADDPEAALQILRAIADLGVTIAIDDFGTGYSSLNYIQRFRVDRLKIDRCFITHVHTSPNDAAIVRSTIALCQSLGIEVIAEGVETRAQASFLVRTGCDELQGYLFSRPVQAASMAEMLKDNKILPLADLTPEVNYARVLLLLDDEVNVLRSLRRLLRHENYHILSTADPDQAMEMLSTYEVGVMITDQRMPQITGTEVLSKVKRIHPETIRIVLSGYTDLNTVIDSINRGNIYRFLTKPWNEEQLKQTLQEAFKLYELERTNRTLTQHISQIKQSMRICWSEPYQLGLKELDLEHKQLIDEFNTFCDSFYLYGPDGAIAPLERLFGTLERHFSTEKRLMSKLGIEQFDEHLGDHQALLNASKKLIASLGQNNSSRLMAETISFIRNWLDSHIMLYDRELAEAVTRSH